MGFTQPGGLYLNEAGKEVDANGNAVKRDEKALKAAAEMAEATAIPVPEAPKVQLVEPVAVPAPKAKRKK